MRLISLSWSCAQKWECWSYVPWHLSKDVAEAPEVNYCGAKQSLARAVDWSSKLYKSSSSCSQWRAGPWSRSTAAPWCCLLQQLWAWTLQLHSTWVCWLQAWSCALRCIWPIFERTGKTAEATDSFFWVQTFLQVRPPAPLAPRMLLCSGCWSLNVSSSGAGNFYFDTCCLPATKSTRIFVWFFFFTSKFFKIAFSSPNTHLSIFLLWDR